MNIKPYTDIKFDCLNTVSFKKDVRDINYYITSGECPNDLRIQFANFLYIKIYNMYKQPKNVKMEHIQLLPVYIQVCENVVLQASYTHYQDDDVRNGICDYFLNNRVLPFYTQLMNDRNLICIKPDELKTHFVNWINNTTDYYERNNLLDVLLKYFPKDATVLEIYQNMQAEQLQRRLDEMKDVNDVNPRNRPVYRYLPTVYSDSQNVHDTDINSSAQKLIDKLIEKYIDIIRENTPEDMKRFIETYFYSINITNTAVLERIFIERSDKLLHLTFALLHHIQNSNYINELNIRLKEEIKDMEHMCTTGHLNRLINVLSGYDDNFSIKISIKNELKAILSNYITKEMTKPEVDENIVAGTYDVEYRPLYITFLEKILNSRILSLYEEYNNKIKDEELKDVLKTITGFEFTIKDKTISVLI